MSQVTARLWSHGKNLVKYYSKKMLFYKICLISSNQKIKPDMKPCLVD